MIALALFGVLVLISILYSNARPSRILRGEKERTSRGQRTPQRWYESAIDLEKAIYGRPSDEAASRLRAHLPKRKIESLQDGYDRERSGLFVVQGLFAS